MRRCWLVFARVLGLWVALQAEGWFVIFWSVLGLDVCCNIVD